MTSEIVERLARIAHEQIADSDPDELIHHPAAKNWEAPTEPRWRQWVELVEAMLQGLREPSDAMVISGAVDFAVTSDAKRVWRGMVDVALTGQPSQLDRTRKTAGGKAP